MFRVALWGTGERTERYLDNGFFSDVDIMYYIDNNTSISEYRGKQVYNPSKIKEMLNYIDYIVIVSSHYIEILIQCIHLYIDWDRLVIVDNEDEALCSALFERLKIIDKKLYEEKQNSLMIKAYRNESDFYDTSIRIGKGRFSKWEYIPYEYFRYRTFEFVARELKRKNVAGAVAELGVFRGTFSSLINDIFPDRKLYMFDTFEGFETEEATKELEMGRCDTAFIEGHKDTSVDKAKNALPYPEMSVICKGFFPNSITDEAMKERYAFVSLDVDFEESTFQGLEFFYPRMSPDGIIFLHDYNTYFLEGVRKAVERYENETGIHLKSIPIADRAGTLIIIK